MYAAFIISGLVDLVGLYSPAGLLPQGTEHVSPALFPISKLITMSSQIISFCLSSLFANVSTGSTCLSGPLCGNENLLIMQGFLSISLLIEGILFGFHLKGSALDMRLHLILVLIIFTSSLVCLLEIKYPQSFLLSSIRAQLVLLQGIWFYQIAAILFKGNFPCQKIALSGASSSCACCNLLECDNLAHIFAVWICPDTGGIDLTSVTSCGQICLDKDCQPD